MTAVIVVTVCAVFVATTFPPSALATADSFGVEDARRYKNVLVPVTITNVQEGPVNCIIFNREYNTYKRFRTCRSAERRSDIFMG